MNNLPRQKLLEIVRRHGREIVAEPRRCEGLMRDKFPAHRREIAVLSAALEERVPAELLAASDASRPPGAALFARLAARLRDDLAMEASAARWAVHTWALALGAITPDELDALEPADGPAERTPHEQVRPIEPSRAPPPHAAATPPAAPSPARPAPPVAAAAVAARTSFVVAAGGGGDFLTITDALRRAPANSRVFVRPGIYDEGFVLDKPFEIVGDGALESIVVRATASSCLVMRADAATVRNLTLRGQAREGGGGNFFAVDVSHGRLLLDGCDVTSDSLACVAIHNPTAAPVIRNCRIHHGADSGVFAFGGARGAVEACDIFENANVAVAVTREASTGVANCHVHHNHDAGIVVWDKAANVVEGCDIYSNRRANVGVSEAGVATLRRCRVHDGENAGVFAHRGGRAVIEECDIYRHQDSEIAVTTEGDASLRGCQIHDGQSHGVFVQEAGRAFLEKCDVFRNRASGVRVDAEGVGVARSCRVNANGHVGVSCAAGGAVDVEGCDLTRNRVAAWQTDHGALVKSRNNRT